MSHLNNHNLSYYLSLHYRYVIEPIPESEGGGFEAYIPTLGRSSCVAVGETEEEALQSLKIAKENLFLFWLEKNLPIPEPQNENQPLVMVGAV